MDEGGFPRGEEYCSATLLYHTDKIRLRFRCEHLAIHVHPGPVPHSPMFEVAVKLNRVIGVVGIAGMGPNIGSGIFTRVGGSGDKQLVARVDKEQW